MSLLRKDYKKVRFPSWVYTLTGSEENHLSGCGLSYCEISMIRNSYHWTKASKAKACQLLTSSVSEAGSRLFLNWALRWPHPLPTSWLQTCEESLSQINTQLICAQDSDSQNLCCKMSVVYVVKFWGICYSAWTTNTLDGERAYRSI